MATGKKVAGQTYDLGQSQSIISPGRYAPPPTTTTNPSVDERTGKPYGSLNAVTPTKKDIPQSIRSKSTELFQSAKLRSELGPGNNQAKNTLIGTGELLGGLGLGYVGFYAEAAFHPIRTAKSMFIDFPVAVATRPGEVASQVQLQVKDNPLGFIGEQAAGIHLFSEVLPFAARKITNTYKSAGAEFVPPEKVFDVPSLRNLQGEPGTNFPTSTSATKALASFEKAREGDTIGVSHATSSLFKKSTVTQEAPRAHAEDTGLYVTPKGQGSPYFLKTSSASATDYQISLNPFSGILKNPTVVNVAVASVERLPRRVLEAKGFEASNEFLRGQTGNSKAFITKRSEVGFERLSGGGRIASANKGVLSTTELEAVIPPGTKLRYVVKDGTMLQNFKGYKEYTRVDDYVVPIKEYEIIGKGDAAFGKVTSSEKLSRSIYDSEIGLSKRSRSLPTYKIGSSKGSAAYESIGKYPYRYESGSSYLAPSRSNYDLSNYRVPDLIRRAPSRSRSSDNYYRPGDSYRGGESYRNTGDSYRAPGDSYRNGGGNSYGGTSKKFVPPPTPKLRLDDFGPSKRRPSFRSRQIPFNPKYVASIEASVFKIKGRASKTNVQSGLGIRPLRTK